MKKLIFLISVICLFSCEKPINPVPEAKTITPSRFCWQCKEEDGMHGASYEVCNKTESEIKIYIFQGVHVITSGTINCTKQ